MEKRNNELINSTSPYLLQHAYNPVNWQPWSEKAIEKAKAENKLILVSIGYAACHWCHVMEHESFEDLEVARVMNENYVCIKVDREEHPDVDNYYMTAVQLMQHQGGWPLNVVALPDGRPVWGGTYFPKDSWIKNLQAIHNYFQSNANETENYAERLQEGIEHTLLVDEVHQTKYFETEILETGVNLWKAKFDLENGGRLGAPKFPMPVNLDFLLYFGFLKEDKYALQFVDITLEQMARGGIYDQLGGGFARYAVDENWKVPHFEKMLYDNGQLLSLYSKGYQMFRKDEYKNVVYETVDFIVRELMDKSGAFYSSLDADSEGEEGKFYVWSKNELKEILEADYELFADYFNVNSKGYWEHGNYILLRKFNVKDFAVEHNLTADELKRKIDSWKKRLMKTRSKRIRPGLDDKTLTSWNALVILGLTDAFKAFGEKKFLNLAIQNAVFLKENVLTEKGKLFHTWKNGKASIDGFLEDYALVVQSLISLYEVTGDEQWIYTAKEIMGFTFDNFHDSDTGLFYFSEGKENSFITNHFQKEDNVVPSANSVMADNLFKMYLIFGLPEYMQVIDKMLQHVLPHFNRYPMAYANWGNLVLKRNEAFYEIVVTGADAQKKTKKMQKEFRPNVLWVFSKTDSEIPILKERLVNDKTLIYVCRNSNCELPVSQVKQAIEKLNQELGNNVV